ncbi:hypothetical protein RRG08_060147 [Elysia crispata]|uniref:Uncharacterized protein n=1 Tax=Elysia crispata TaxID=231223 RepID=A0AAE0ZZ49_9GAST|nr:hypothetical protein RRG08_060147 [Elysia crispata]
MASRLQVTESPAPDLMDSADRLVGHIDHGETDHAGKSVKAHGLFTQFPSSLTPEAPACCANYELQAPDLPEAQPLEAPEFNLKLLDNALSTFVNSWWSGLALTDCVEWTCVPVTPPAGRQPREARGIQCQSGTGEDYRN